MKHAITILMLLFASTHSFYAQMEWGLDYRQKIGFLAAHRGVMAHIPQHRANAGELTFFVHTKGKKAWHKACGFPTVGATIFGGSVGNNEILGTYWGSYGFIEFPFVHAPHYRFLGKLGAGMGFGTKVFDQETNPKNTAMSTHLNALLCVGIRNEWTFDRNQISLGLDMTHFSNGASKVPNLGVNLPYLSLGYGRVLQHAFKDSVTQPYKNQFEKWLFSLNFIGSMKEIFPTNGKKYPVLALSASARYFARPKVGFEGAFDIISKQAIIGYKPEIEKSQWDLLQMGVFAGYLVPLDQFHFVIGMGLYLKDKYRPEDFVYHRIGIRYSFTNGLNTQVVLKSHWARADYIEWGLGYTFNRNK